MKRILVLLTVLAASAFTASAQFTITNTSLPNAIVGTNYPFITLSTTGGSSGVIWSISQGSLPSGFVVGSAPAGLPTTNGTFCVGTVTQTGGAPNCSNPIVQSTPNSYTFTITAMDSKENQTSKQFTIVVGSPVQLTTQTLPNAFMGQPYSFPLQATGGAAAFGSGQYLWSVINGMLPPTFTLDQSTGILSSANVGTVGSFSFTIAVSDSSTGSIGARPLLLGVTLPLQIQQITLPSALVGVAYQATLTATGGTQPYQWSLSGSTQGLTIQNTGSTVMITGVPPTAGNFVVTVTLREASGAFISQNFMLQVVAQLMLTNLSLSSSEVGILYNQQVMATGGVAPYTFTTTGSLPPGLALNSTTGVLQGTPTTAGLFPFVLKVTDAAGQFASPTLNFTVAAPLSIATASLPFASTGSAYSQTLSPSGGVAPINWVVYTGFLPPGIMLNANTGVLSGAPTATGAQTFTIRAVDQVGGSALKTLTLTVVGPGQTLIITSPSSFPASVGVAFSQVLTASGGVGAFSWTVVSGSLPPGLILIPAGNILGTPTTPGPFTFTVKVSDSVGQAPTASVTITVTGQLSITTTSIPPGVVGRPYSQALVATGGFPTLSWSILGAGPAGISINASTGVLSGTPTTLGAQAFTVQVIDSLQSAARQTYTLTVNTVLSITSSGSFTGTVGVPFSQTLAATGGVLSYTWSVSSGTLPGGLQLNAATGALTGTPTAKGVTNVDLQVADSGGQTAVLHATFTISLPTNPTTSIGVGTTTQPPVIVALSAPFPLNINGTMNLSFVSSVGGTDKMIQFNNGSSTLSFQIPAGATQATFPSAPNAAVITGTLAGTITLQVTTLAASDGTNLLPGSPLTRTIVTAPAVPVITQVTLQQVTGGINVIATGYSNTREISSGLFHFTVTSGNSLSQSDITVPLTSAYTTWFSSSPASDVGGLFKLTMPFNVTQGMGTAVTGVQVTLTNRIGPSAAVNSQ